MNMEKTLQRMIEKLQSECRSENMKKTKVFINRLPGQHEMIENETLESGGIHYTLRK